MRRLLSLILAAALALTACTPPPPPSDGGVPVVTRGGWADTARLVLSTLRWSVPAARAILSAALPEPARTRVARALDAVADAAGRLELAVQAYEARGGDLCPAHAAVGATTVALVQLAQVLTDGGVALGPTFERAADGLGSIGDAIFPACHPDGGFYSGGEAVNAQLRAIANGARARGLVLRPLLDDLRPLDAGR